MRRFFKITGISLLIILIALIATPFLFKGKLEDLLKRTLNERLDAKVAWKSLDLSLLKSFPNAALTVTEFSVINTGVFEGDTLIYGDKLELDMGIKQLFKKADDDPIDINTFILDGAIVNIKINEDGTTNYDISKNNDQSAAESTDKTNVSTPFALGLKHYELRDSKINYLDKGSKTFLQLSDLNHTGNGDFSTAQSNLETATTAKVSFDLDETNYLKNNDIKLVATIAMDLTEQRYSFLENKALINALPLTFDGFVQLLDGSTEIDLSFQTPESDFKNFLAVIPSTYAKNLDNVETSGDFSVSGKLKGIANDTYIPTMDITITSSNASFNYPSLPKKMDRINIDASIKNDTGITDDTYITINNLSFRIDEDTFTANGKLRNLTTNILINLALKGSLNLANIGKVYPMEFDDPLSGLLNVDMTTSFDMDAIDTHQYSRIKSSGTANLTDLEYTSDQLPKTLFIDQATITLTPERITLDQFIGKSGETDVSATGSMENLIPFVMSKEDLKGRFKVRSKVFDLHDFMVPEVVTIDTPSSESGEKKNTESFSKAAMQVQIPDFLDAELDFQAEKVIYDDLMLTNVSGIAAVTEETAQLRNVVSDIFGGKAGISGTVSTKEQTPIFDVILDLTTIDITQSFEKLDLLKGLAPIAKAVQGAFTSKIQLQGNLDKDLSPVLSTIAGDAFAQLITATVDPEKTPLIATLDNQLEFIDLSKVDLSQLKTKLHFEDGQIAVDPFDFKVEDVIVAVQGGHRFDNTMNYTISLDVPASYMGGDISRLLATLKKEERDNLSVQLPVSLSGNFKQPNVKINTQVALTDLTNQIIEIQKQHVQDQVDDKIEDVLDDVLGNLGVGKNDSKDSTATDDQPKVDDVIKDTAGDLLKDLFGGKKKKKKKKGN